VGLTGSSWSFSSLGGILHWHERVRVSWVHEVGVIQLLMLNQVSTVAAAADFEEEAYRQWKLLL